MKDIVDKLEIKENLDYFPVAHRIFLLGYHMTSCGEKQIESDLRKTIGEVRLRLYEFHSALVYKEVLNERRYQTLF